MATTRTLKRTTIINRSLGVVFDFFSKAENLNKLTPSNLHFKILSPLPVKMQPGTLIDYQLRLMGVPFKWQTEITVWEPPHRFIDIQKKGPYKLWIHEHIFEEKEGKTIMYDLIEYKFPGGIFESFIHHFFVKKGLQNIFGYREKTCMEIFKG
jgi:ligand-binding SRPBCC domain-containing protein